MMRYRHTLLLIGALFIFTGCIERGFLMPTNEQLPAVLYPANPATNYQDPISIDENKSKSKVVNQHNAKDKNTLFTEDVQNLIAGAFVVLIGIAMLL